MHLQPKNRTDEEIFAPPRPRPRPPHHRRQTRTLNSNTPDGRGRMRYVWKIAGQTPPLPPFRPLLSTCHLSHQRKRNSVLKFRRRQTTPVRSRQPERINRSERCGRRFDLSFPRNKGVGCVLREHNQRLFYHQPNHAPTNRPPHLPNQDPDRITTNNQRGH